MWGSVMLCPLFVWILSRREGSQHEGRSPESEE